MPNGGLAIYGSGMRLQPVTPGAADTGNFNVSGKGITQDGFFPGKLIAGTGYPLEQWPMDIGYNNSYPALMQPDDLSSCLVIGTSNTVQMNTNGNNVNYFVCIGYQNAIKGGEGVTIGYLNQNGSNNLFPASVSRNVVIGVSCIGSSMSTQQGSVCIGVQAQESTNGVSEGSILIGYIAKSINSAGNNIVIGRNCYISNASNSILINTQDPSETILNTSNTVKIGDTRHTTIKLGGMTLTKGTIVGSRGGNAALASLLSYLATAGVIIDSTTA